jgi:two-component system chemotaxis sensor kinase CheA
MSMDAVTLAAAKSLHQEFLPKLAKLMESMVKSGSANDASKQQLAMLIGEVSGLLNIMSRWSGVSEVKQTSSAPALAAAATEETDEDAAKMLADLEGSSGGETAAPTEEISDDEAAMMLADMDAPAEPAESEEISDDDAAKMLADMDAPAAPAATAAPKDISDDEAAMLLADMDAPPDAEASGDMSDDDAAKLLADMDAPAAPAAKPVAVAKAAVATDDEDDADSLLAKLEQDSSPMPAPAAARPAAVSAKPAAAKPAAASAHAADIGEKVEEIPEWEPNDFQSDADMMVDFQNNTGELMDNLDTTILRLEQEPENKEVIEEIFRAAHTLKGAAGMFGFRGLERVMHRTENLFDLIRKGKMVPNSDIIDVVFQAMDVMKTLLGAVKTGKPSGVETAPIVTALTLVALGKSAAGVIGERSGATAEATPADDHHEAPAAAAPAAASSGGGHDDHGGGAKDAGKKKGAAPAEEATIRVDLQRLDALVNLIGELVIDRTRFVHVEEQLRQNLPQLPLTGNMTETLQLFGRHMNEVQDIIMKVRMVPIGNAFNKYPRVVRDLARKLGKKIELQISGETAELDKTLVEQIGDPLIHLIRNSCDHGVEMPEVREKAGKNPTGVINLSARQEGNHIVITIEDDGKGIPVDIIRKKGIEKGLIKAEDVLTNKDIFNLIFEAGFSTAEKVTEVSGRGVGMDVVKRQIQKLKGMIDIDSTQGKGTSMSIQLPLTLAIVQSLLIQVDSETFAIPLTSVIESLRISPNEIQRVGDSEIIKIRDQVLPLIHLKDVLDVGQRVNSLPSMMKSATNESAKAATSRRKARRKERLYVVVVGSADRRFGIVVDQLLNQQEMVIKSMGPLMKGIPCVAGGAVLGHGEVVLVLDIAEIIQQARSRTRKSANAA